ncbi:uncharacterized protein LOC123657426 [Melitaea cinxia]|uniref:uncharacterized protein LOC123657426 n=1 Tax=Melitaea cinxia TaxID=113334 RepID=UPI001E2717BE|nr:uncharacterized protein LOC123657426 [Melitaea cinxia]
MEYGVKENRIAALHKVGMESSIIFQTLQKLGISRMFVYRTINRYSNTLSVEDQKRSGPPRVDSAPGHKARTTQAWLETNVPDFIRVENWPSSSPDPLDFKLWSVLEDMDRLSDKATLSLLKIFGASSGEISLGNYVSLTTSKLRKSTSPKPTTLHKRINVDRNYYESANSSGLEELLQYVGAKNKRNSETYSIVDWDYWCRLQVRKGNCQKALERFYYDIQTDECKPFVYTGCGGNKNNFYTSDFCERNCKGALDTNIKDLERPEFCSLQAQTGFCLALISQFYYDINEETCLKFNYGGCGGNQNRFSSMSACMKTCSDKEEESE